MRNEDMGDLEHSLSAKRVAKMLLSVADDTQTHKQTTEPKPLKKCV